MKRCSASMSVARLNPSALYDNAVRFIFAQLFFGFFDFNPNPI